MTPWIASFVRDRTNLVKRNECLTNLVNNSKEIPQGSILSPILYLFYKVDLIKVFSSSSHQITEGGYIDDIVLLVTVPSIKKNYQKLKKTHRLFVNWAIKHESKSDFSKYQLVHSSRKQNIDINRDLTLDGNHPIKAQKSGIVLGVEIDNKLKGKHHLHRIKIRASKSITAPSWLDKSVLDRRFKTIKLLYQSIVIPQLTYFCSV